MYVWQGRVGAEQAVAKQADAMNTQDIESRIVGCLVERKIRIRM